jgi:hypothetical protein
MAAQLKEVLQNIEKKKARIRECEKEIAQADDDLREIDCPRTRCLGKDRFWNRYWFLERNAMPWGGLHYSSTADAEYANGCVWVQGPDDMERAGFIDVPPDEEQRYRRAFQMTVAQRKRLEEGATSLFTARQWGYYDEPDALDKLIGWLDARGNREIRLRKELQALRGRIVTHMEKRRAYLDEQGPAGKKGGRGGGGGGDEQQQLTRMSTRTKSQPPPPQFRCQRWKNTMALRECGHLHIDQPRPRKPPPGRKGEATTAAAAKAAAGGNRGAAKRKR